MLKRINCIVLFAVAAVSACTTELNAVRIDKNSPVPSAGAPYSLTFTQYDIQITQRLVGCYEEKENIDPAKTTGAERYDLKKPKIKVAVVATATKSEIRDPTQTYVIDLASLQNFFKSTDVKVSYYDNGAIKSINAEADDKTGEFIASVSQTIFKVASAAIIGPQSLEECTKDAWTALLKIQSKTDELEKISAAINISTDELKQFISVATALGRNTPKNSRESIVSTLAKLNTQLAQQKIIQQSLKEELDWTAVVTKAKWPENGRIFSSTTPLAEAVEKKQFDKWINNSSEDRRIATAAYFAIRPLEPIGLKQPCLDNCTEDHQAGLKYRMPALGKIYMCSALKEESNPLSDADKASGKKAVSWQTCDIESAKTHKIDSKAEMISQLGRMYSLPLKSIAFSKRTIAATFSENGIPTLLGTTSTAGSEKLSSSAGSVADAKIAYDNTKLGREKTALENQLAIGKLRKEIAALAPLPPPPPAKDQARLEAIMELSGDTALLKAEIANAEAKSALAELNKLAATVN